MPEHTTMASSRPDPRHKVLDGGAVGDVAKCRARLMPVAAKLVRHGRCVADVGQNELRAQGGAYPGCARSDAARAAGDEHGLARKREWTRGYLRHERFFPPVSAS
jgi:hypothetical protein